MKYLQGTILLAVLVMFLSFQCGCQSAAFEEGTFTGQGLDARYTQPATPGIILSTHQDGSQTAIPLPVKAPVVTPPNKSPVIQVMVIAPTPGVVESYVITPEVQKGDKVAGSRFVTWAGEAPGTVVEKVAVQKQKGTQNPLPAVDMDAKGIHISAGGGSTQEQAGMSWWQRAWVAVSDLFKGISMWLLVIGIGLGAIFILPLFIPALVPVMAKLWGSIRTMLGWFWDVVEKIIAWFEAKMKAKTPPPPPV